MPLLVLVVLVVVNAALIAVLWSQRQVTGAPVDQVPMSSPPEPSPTEVESSSATPSPSPSPTESTDDEVVVPARLLLATSAKEAWRASVGDCKKPGRVEHSTDGGKSWRRAVKPTLGPIVRLELEANGDLYTVGGNGADCSIRYIAYSTDGAIAAQTDKPQGIWSRDPKDPDRIQGPTSARATPCKRRHVIGLAALDMSTALTVCTDGSVMVTSNSGKSWKRTDELSGTMAVGGGGDRLWVAGKGKKCHGVAVQSFSLTAPGKLSRDGSRCVRDAALSPGLIAVDGRGKAVWLWAGKKIQVSTDRGRTWKSR